MSVAITFLSIKLKKQEDNSSITFLFILNPSHSSLNILITAFDCQGFPSLCPDFLKISFALYQS